MAHLRVPQNADPRREIGRREHGQPELSDSKRRLRATGMSTWAETISWAVEAA
jgi:hypothetical protein